MQNVSLQQTGSGFGAVNYDRPVTPTKLAGRPVTPTKLEGRPVTPTKLEGRPGTPEKLTNTIANIVIS